MQNSMVYRPFKADSSIFESNGFELGSTGLVISPLVPSGWDDRCSAVQRISRLLCTREYCQLLKS